MRETTFTKNLLACPVDGRVAVEIGDSKQSDFKPQAKLIRHGNRANLSLRYKGAEPVSFAETGDTIVADFGGDLLELYDKPEEKAFELELVLLSRPVSNRFMFSIRSKGVTEWAYQPELTEEEVREGCWRPENVVGSYALYGDQGKLFHIYRPHILDAAGKACWGEFDLDLSQEKVTVVVPHEFLDDAVYPVRVDPTIGYTSVGASNFKLSTRKHYVTSHPSSNLDLNKFYAYVKTDDSYAAIYGNIYDDDGVAPPNINPYTHICTAYQYYSTPPSLWQWVQLSFLSGYGTGEMPASGDVWLGLWVPSDCPNVYVAYDSGASGRTKAATATTPLANFPTSGITFYSRILSAYVDTVTVNEISVPVTGNGSVSAAVRQVRSVSVPVAATSSLGAACAKIANTVPAVTAAASVTAAVQRIVLSSAAVTIAAATEANGQLVLTLSIPVASESAVAVEALQAYADPYAIMAVSVTGTASVAVGVTDIVQSVSAGVTGEMSVVLASVLQFGVVKPAITVTADVEAAAAVIRPVVGIAVSVAADIFSACDSVCLTAAAIENSVSCDVGMIEMVLAVSVPISSMMEPTTELDFIQYIAVPVASDSAFTAEVEQVSNNRIKYRVTHPVYGERVYEVIVTVLKSTENSILTFYFLASENSVLGDDVNALIQNGRIRASFPYGTDVTALVPYIEISPEASIDPGSGVVKDFTSPVLYTVVAESGAVQTYETQFTVLASGLNNMLSFRFLMVNNPLLSNDLDAVMSDASAIVLAPGSMTDAAIGALKPSIQVSEHAQVIPANLQERDFSETVLYEVTAQNGDKKTYRADLYRKGDIGGPSIPGSVTVFNDVLTMSGGGTGITGSSDKFHFLYRKMSGDCTIEAFVESMTNPGAEACAGIMLRSTLAANAKHAFLCQLQTVTDYQKPIQLRARSTTGGSTDTAYELYIDQTVKNGFRLVKSGTQIRAYSRRGESGTWYLRQTMTLDLGTEFYAGIAVTSGTNAAACTAVVKGFGVV